MLLNTLFRKIIFALNCLILAVLLLIAFKEGVFQFIGSTFDFSLLTNILTNSWIISICSSIIAVFLIYKWQVWYSKKKLKADFRCNEVISSVYDGIDYYNEIRDKLPSSEYADFDQFDFLSRKEKAQKYVDFYKNNIGAIDIANLAMSYDGNDLLLESIQSCFFINLNFELLGIVNNIKNRLPNLRNRYPKIEDMYVDYKKNPNEDILIRLGDALRVYFIDLGCMAEYWESLFEYLEYNHEYVKLFVDTYNQKYSIAQDIKAPLEERINHIKEAEKLAKKQMRKKRWKQFWD